MTICDQRLLVARFVATASLAVLAAQFSLGGATAARSAENASPEAYCAKVVNDDETKTIPDSLFAKAARALDFSTTDENFLRPTVWRCMNGRVLVCHIGANILCEADETQALNGATEFCRQQPDATGVPMSATGHGTIYSWSCHGRKSI